MEGRLVLYFGPMGSGKTTILLHKLAEFHDLGYKVLFVRSLLDTRKTEWHSSLNIELPDYLCPQIIEQLDACKCINYDVIGIDEAQFFNDLEYGVKRLLKLGKIVFVAGLDGDYKGEIMGKIHKLIHLADEVNKLTAICRNCLRDGQFKTAIFTKRVSDEKETIVVGGMEKYEPVCRKCFFN